MKKLGKKRHISDRLQLLAAILAQWQWPATSIKALDHLYWAMHAVLYRRISAAVKTASNYGTFFYCCFICCCPGGRWGNTTWILTWWQGPVVSGLAMDPLHQAMCAVLYRHISLAVKTGRIGGACANIRLITNDGATWAPPEACTGGLWQIEVKWFWGCDFIANNEVLINKRNHK